MKDPELAFAVRTGLGTGGALLVTPWVPPFRDVLSLYSPALYLGVFLAIAIGLSVFLSTVRVRHGKVLWLGSRLTMVGGVAALAAGLTHVLILTLFNIRNFSEGLYVVSVAEIPEFAGVIALASLLSMWLALRLAHWIAPQQPRLPSKWSRWDPRSWGVMGNLGMAMSLVAGTVLTWIEIGLARSCCSSGPNAFGILLVGGLASLTVTVGLLALVMDIGSKRTSDP